MNALPAVINWGESFYPNMRFGLSMALMNNGFSIYNIGDVNGDGALWFDEYNFNLGSPATPATLIGAPGGTNKLVNSGFDGALAPWTLAVAHDGVAAATAALDTTIFEDGTSSAHVNVTSAGTRELSCHAATRWCLGTSGSGIHSTVLGPSGFGADVSDQLAGRYRAYSELWFDRLDYFRHNLAPVFDFICIAGDGN